MKSLGFDIGTSSISGIVIDDNREIIEIMSCNNEYEISKYSFEKTQNPNLIISKSREIIDLLLDKYPDIASIGLTGQMHGILYVDANGKAVSDFYTWEDKRGDIKLKAKESYAESLSKKTFQKLHSGYGAVTHYYNSLNGLVPHEAKSICTIPDYLGLSLTKSREPILDSTMAASIGLFSSEVCDFDRKLISKTGMMDCMFPTVRSFNMIGRTRSSIPVYSAIGDNQASFYGATGDNPDVLLVNFGTGGQISIVSDEFLSCKGIEMRPYINNRWLAVGAPLCGGESYAILENFFRQSCKCMTGNEQSAYDMMSKITENMDKPNDLPLFCTQFNGTRENPSLRGSISGISSKNFTPQHFVYGMLYGMALDMYAYYTSYLENGGKAAHKLIGSGNGLRKNPALCKAVSDVFGIPLELSLQQEEAAFGAAVYGRMLAMR